jgi:hypothetical protein
MLPSFLPSFHCFLAWLSILSYRRPLRSYPGELARALMRWISPELRACEK